MGIYSSFALVIVSSIYDKLTNSIYLSYMQFEEKTHFNSVLYVDMTSRTAELPACLTGDNSHHGQLLYDE